MLQEEPQAPGEMPSRVLTALHLVSTSGRSRQHPAPLCPALDHLAVRLQRASQKDPERTTRSLPAQHPLQSQITRLWTTHSSLSNWLHCPRSNSIPRQTLVVVGKEKGRFSWCPATGMITFLCPHLLNWVIQLQLKI